VNINLNDYRARKTAAMAYHPSVRPIPIWGRQDAIDTAQEFRAELANAERGSFTDIAEPAMSDKGHLSAKLFGRSRFRRAKVYDGIAVALFLVFMFFFGAVVWAASAKADPDAEAADYASTYGGVVCNVLDDYPSVSGMLGIMQAIQKDGLTEYQAGEVVGIAISDRCPEYSWLAKAFVKRYGASAA
jgi:hypothetical protein